MLMQIIGKFFSRNGHKLYAKLTWNSWAPCPICGDYFGGHEAHQLLLRRNGPSLMTCGKVYCRIETERRNRELSRELARE